MIPASSIEGHFKTIIEPFRIKSVEPIQQRTSKGRRTALILAGYNPFLLKAEDVLIDLLTDSGTGALSKHQWAAMMRSDESYAGADSFYRFEEAVLAITGLKHIIPTHQGRAAERILFSTILKPGDLVPNNTHFDTTRANVEACGATALDLPCREAKHRQSLAPFKGNIDLTALDRCLTENKGRVPLAMITVTNNSGGGQPVSLENLRKAREICLSRQVPLFLDCCRFAENAWFIKTREPSMEKNSPIEIARSMFACVDGATMSAKKDGMSNIGGFLAMNDSAWAERCKNNLILTEGFPTYGGLAGYDLEAIAVGLFEALEEDYLRYRVRSIEYLGDVLTKAGVPILLPTGGHAVYIDAKVMLPHIPQSQYPAWALSCALYLAGGVRGVEIGSVMFGRKPDGTEVPAEKELVRLAFPRRVYTQSHVDYLAEVILHVHGFRDQICGVKMVKAPVVLRHFTAIFSPVGETLIGDEKHAVVR